MSFGGLSRSHVERVAAAFGIWGQVGSDRNLKALLIDLDLDLNMDSGLLISPFW